MAKLTLAVGAVLVLLGLGAYFGTGQQSVTALIPSFFGVPLVVLGLWGEPQKNRKLAMHIAVVLTLLGFLGTIRAVFKLPAALAGTAERPAAIYVQVIMAVITLAHVVLAVRSFIAARRARRAAESPAAS